MTKKPAITSELRNGNDFGESLLLARSSSALLRSELSDAGAFHKADADSAILVEVTCSLKISWWGQSMTLKSTHLYSFRSDIRSNILRASSSSWKEHVIKVQKKKKRKLFKCDVQVLQMTECEIEYRLLDTDICLHRKCVRPSSYKALLPKGRQLS